MKYTILGIVLILTCSFLSVYLLKRITDRTEVHNFSRKIQSRLPERQRSWELGQRGYYIAGKSADAIYLANIFRPYHLLSINTTTNAIKELSITRGYDTVRSSNISIDPPYFYLVDQARFHIYRGSLQALVAERYIDDVPFFSEAVPVSNSATIFRTTQADKHEYTLAKRTSSHQLKRMPGLLEKQVDGLFCVDGKLQYNKARNILLYVYYYRNQFLCMDTSLNLLFRANTIDDVSQARIKVADVKRDHARMLASPPYIVNKKYHTSATKIYVNSRIKAANERKDDFESSSVVDIYDLSDGHYESSFYIRDYLGNDIDDFRIYSDTLFALHNNILVTYKLTFYP
ncbi:MAG TPA: hypothetical protein VD816_11925 [Ohtaekwangia sp.]|nr:hypothetical protein [Ohtaekwangia sp.]